MAASNLVSVVVGQYLAPALKADGWRRTGASFRWDNDAGDQAVIGIRRTLNPVRDAASFFVDAALWTEAYIDLIRATGDLGAHPHAERGVFSGSILHPDTRRQWWDVTPETVASCGHQLVDVVAGEVAPGMVKSLSRDNLFTLRRTNAQPPGMYWHEFDPTGVILAFLVDEGPSDEVEELVREAHEYARGPLVEAWVRRRLASRTPDDADGNRLEGNGHRS